jgi:hypothetical protein
MEAVWKLTLHIRETVSISIVDATTLRGSSRSIPYFIPLTPIYNPESPSETLSEITANVGI